MQMGLNAHLHACMHIHRGSHAHVHRYSHTWAFLMSALEFTSFHVGTPVYMFKCKCTHVLLLQLQVLHPQDCKTVDHKVQWKKSPLPLATKVEDPLGRPSSLEAQESPVTGVPVAPSFLWESSRRLWGIGEGHQASEYWEGKVPMART